MDALDLAKLIEFEAHERYKMFASQLGRGGGYDPGAFFATMAENEAKHGQELAARRKALFGDAPARVTLDDLYDVEAPEMGAPHRGMSTVQAFEVGLAAEKKAYDFYDMALPGVTDPEVRALFTELRDEETEHVEMLQKEMAKLPPSAGDEVEFDIDESPSL
jgi:rubrerythrin